MFDEDDDLAYLDPGEGDPDEYLDEGTYLAERRPRLEGQHEFDEDAVCIHCGFDGAEWWHWKHSTYEGKASEARQPRCTA